MRQALACGTAMASIAIEGFSPLCLAQVGPEEIARRVEVLHRMVHFKLQPIFEARP